MVRSLKTSARDGQQAPPSFPASEDGAGPRRSRGFPSPSGQSDEGFEATDDLVRRVHGEAASLFGLGRAILLQLAHPLVTAAVHDHSVFATRPEERLHRLWRTTDALLAMMGGPPEVAARAAAAVNAIHGRVRGHLPDAVGPFPAGTPYAASDPTLLRWVHATLVDSLPLAYERYVGPLTGAERDRYCAAGNGMGLLLRLPAGDLPTDAAALARYLDAMLTGGELVVTDQARALAHELLSTPYPGAPRPLRRLIRLATIGLLPPAIRAGYDVPWDRRHDAAVALSATAIRRLRPLLPTEVSRWRGTGRGPVPEGAG